MNAIFTGSCKKTCGCYTALFIDKVIKDFIYVWFPEILPLPLFSSFQNYWVFPFNQFNYISERNKKSLPFC